VQTLLAKWHDYQSCFLMSRSQSFPSADGVPVRLQHMVITSPNKKVLIFGAQKEKLHGLWRKTQNMFFEMNIATDLRIFWGTFERLLLYETEENCEKS